MLEFVAGLKGLELLTVLLLNGFCVIVDCLNELLALLALFEKGLVFWVLEGFNGLLKGLGLELELEFA